MLSGCALPATREYELFGGRPAIGITVEEEAVRNIDTEHKTRLNLVAGHGVIRITRGSRQQLTIREKMKLTGPASKERLEALLDSCRSETETTAVSINIDKKPEEELKALYGLKDEIELIVPESIKAISVEAGNAEVYLSGLGDMSSVDISVDKGIVDAQKCSSRNLLVSVGDGSIIMDDVNGNCTYECVRGDILLDGVKGIIELKSAAGDTTIKNSGGKLNCSITAGRLNVKDSAIEDGSMLYATNGDISADLRGLSGAGKFTAKASAGSIRLDMPDDTGWSLIARSAKGRVVNRMVPVPEALKKSPSGEIYGDVGEGGPTIDIYIDTGDIFLN